MTRGSSNKTPANVTNIEEVPPDRLGLRSSGIAGMVRVKLGSIDLTRAFVKFSTSGRVNELNTAELTLVKNDPQLVLADFFGEITVDQEFSGYIRRVFTGNIVQVVSDDEEIRLKCESMPEINDRRVRGIQYSDNARLDVLYALVRSAGVPEARTNIEGLKKQPFELFEIVTPVYGITTAGPAQIGPITIYPSKEIDFRQWYQNASEEMLAEFRKADALAVNIHAGRVMYDAEQSGISAIDTAMAWLLVRARNSSARLPGGIAQTWERDLSLASPFRLGPVSVRGMTTGRRWVRHVEDSLKAVLLDLKDIQGIVLHDRIDQTLRQALLSASRAAVAPDPVNRVTALWEAIEHYVGETTVPPLYSKEEIRDFKQRLKGASSGPKQERLLQIIGQLNNPPLLARLRHRLAEDGISVSSAEIDLLVRLRNVRNNVVHGKPAALPTDTEIQYGVAVVARMLTAAVHRATAPSR